MRGPPKEPKLGVGRNTTHPHSAQMPPQDWLLGLVPGAVAQLHGSYLLGVPLAKFLKLLEAHFLHL